jgi:hypothetical protein
MLAQVVLTPTESKKLIATSIAKLDVVKKAKTVILHPSSSTYFIVEAITGYKPRTNVWVCGVVMPKGLCGDMAVHHGRAHITRDGGLVMGPGGFSACWVIRGKKVSVGTPLSDLLNEIEPDDVYIKGVNAIDTQSDVGVLIGNSVEGGTIGLVVSKWREKAFHLVFPVGFEKMIPNSIGEATKLTRSNKYDYGMGVASYLFPCPRGPRAMVVTETKAIEILSGSTAIPIAAGGLGGAEGATVLLIKGNKARVKKAIGYVELSKGAELPPIRVANCYDCPRTFCKFPVYGKSWAKW